MTLLQIAFKNISRDKHTYFSYFISSTVTILLFYLFTAAAMHPDLNEIQDGSTLALALGAGNFIIYVFAFLFIGYSSWAFLGSRGKQLGIYIILGMSPKQMKKMLFGENMLIGISSLIAGVISGVLFSGLFFKLIRNIFVTISFDMYVPVLPLLITIGLFFVMFLVISFITPYFISHKKVLWFLKSDKSYAGNIKVSPVKIFLSIVLLMITLFIMTPQVGNKLGDLWTPLVFLFGMMVIFLITPQIGAVYVKVKKSSKNHLSGINLFANSEVSTTLKENGHMMSLNAVLLTMSFLAICALGSMQSNVMEDVENITPFAYTYIERPENVRAEQDIAYLDKELLSDASIQKVNYTILREEFTYGFLSARDFNHILSAKGKETVTLGSHDVLILSGDASRKQDKVFIQKKAKQLLDAISISETNIKPHEQIVSTSGSFQAVYVVSDENWEKLNQKNFENLYLEFYTGYEDSKWLNHLNIADKLEKALAHDDIDYDYTYSFTTLGNYYNIESLMRKLCTFVGFSVSLIFLIASVSLIYFRLYTSLEREKKKYESMYKLGFSQKEMYRTVGRKIKVLLWIPFLIAIIIMWSGILYIDSQSAVSSFGMSIKYSITFIIVYFIFYHFVNIIYRKKFSSDM